MKKTFKLKDIDPIIFSGARDENIKIIENSFNSKIVLRGNNLIVDGLKKEINEIELLIENIMYTITNKGFINSKDIDILIKSSLIKDIPKNGESKLDNVPVENSFWSAPEVPETSDDVLVGVDQEYVTPDGTTPSSPLRGE